MAEVNEGSKNAVQSSKNIRSRKLNSKVDLTAMVDLAFLLITFFMLTTSFGKPTSMDLEMPKDGKPMPVDENRTMTILIGSDNHINYYMGKFGDNATNDIDLRSGELRNELTARKKQVGAYSDSKGKPDQGMIVLIKPGKNSNYGNLVEVLDEMAISNVQTYAIVDIQADENALLSKSR